MYIIVVQKYCTLFDCTFYGLFVVTLALKVLKLAKNMHLTVTNAVGALSRWEGST